MKQRKLITELKHLAASFIFFFCIIALIFLIALIYNNLISGAAFWGCLGILAVMAYLDAKWLDKHFIDGEWQ